MGNRKYSAALSMIVAACFLPLAVASTSVASEDSTRAVAIAGAPVVFEGDTLFTVYARLGPYGPEDRAASIADRMSRIAKNRVAPIDSLILSRGETSTDVLSGDVVIMTITDSDAMAAGTSRAQLAREMASIAHMALKKEASDTTLKSILLGAVFAVLATFALIFAFKLVNRLSRGVHAFVEAQRGTRIASLKIQKLEVLSADRMTDALLGLLKGLRIAAYVILVYLGVPLILSFFPWTRGIAGTIIGQALSPLGIIWRAFVSYLPNVFYVAAIVFVTRYVLKVVRWFFGQLEKGTISLPNFYKEWAVPTYKIVSLLLMAFAAIVIFPYLPGAGSPGFQGVSVFLGVLVSLGSASSISHVIAGVVLTYTRAFNVGDRVKIADTIGDVTEKTLLVTRIRTIKNVDITIPNAMVLGSHIINFSSSAQEKGLILHTSVTIGYDAPWKKVHGLLIDAANSTEHILKDPLPFVLQTSLDDFFVTYELNAFTDKPTSMATIFSELHQHIQDKFNEAGVEIMSPHYAAVRDGNQAAIPETYLPKSYSAPGFRILPLGNAGRPSEPSST